MVLLSCSMHIVRRLRIESSNLTLVFRRFSRSLISNWRAMKGPCLEIFRFLLHTIVQTNSDRFKYLGRICCLFRALRLALVSLFAFLLRYFDSRLLSLFFVCVFDSKIQTQMTYSIALFQGHLKRGSSILWINPQRLPRNSTCFGPWNRSIYSCGPTEHNVRMGH